ncbi:hypothetical protein LOC68_02310 [Blastopirellula sp. JC732]|uniref:J domain-containing protein n=1 Tax=Blastopirellula sediminis TaxID=2894196 RepID=A0A9X1MI69_9BACT|nr:hypothetical protein [Blastopirellula sediminis]MCC9607976.1 hypothetical protein [Blastopirellula sediminis]MCC9627231.1 hypothetical protein [Blastopirellula sediminis]
MTPEAEIQWKLLGISPAEYPPSLYRLLELPLFTSDPAAIEAAYQRQIARVQPYISGPDVVQCVDLLNKLQQARTTLLDSTTKAAYDAALQQARPSAPSSPAAASQPKAAPSPRPNSARPKKQPPKRKEMPVAARMGLMAVLFVVTVVMTVAFLRPEAFGIGGKPTDVATSETPQPEPTIVAAPATPEVSPKPAPTPVFSPPKLPQATTLSEAQGRLDFPHDQPVDLGMFFESQYVIDGSWRKVGSGLQPNGEHGAKLEFEQAAQNFDVLFLCSGAGDGVSLCANGATFWRDAYLFKIGFLDDPKTVAASASDVKFAPDSPPISTLNDLFVMGLSQRGPMRQVILFPDAMASRSLSMAVSRPKDVAGGKLQFVGSGKVTILKTLFIARDANNNGLMPEADIVKLKQEMLGIGPSAVSVAMPPAAAMVPHSKFAPGGVWEPVDKNDFSPKHDQFDMVTYLMKFAELRPLVLKALQVPPQERQKYPVSEKVFKAKDAAKKVYQGYLNGPKERKDHDAFFVDAIDAVLDMRADPDESAGLLELVIEDSERARNFPHQLMAGMVKARLFQLDAKTIEYRTVHRYLLLQNGHLPDQNANRLYGLHYCLGNARHRLQTAPEEANGYLELIWVNCLLLRQFKLYQDEALNLMNQVDATFAAPAALSAAHQRLQQNPDDRYVNHALGIIHCLVLDDWDVGLPMLAKSAEYPYSRAARLELGDSSTGEQQLAIAEAWYSCKGIVGDGRRDAVLKHAREWFERAEPNLTGLAKKKAELGIKESTPKGNN